MKLRTSLVLMAVAILGGCGKVSESPSPQGYWVATSMRSWNESKDRSVLKTGKHVEATNLKETFVVVLTKDKQMVVAKKEGVLQTEYEIDGSILIDNAPAFKMLKQFSKDASAAALNPTFSLSGDTLILQDWKRHRLEKIELQRVTKEQAQAIAKRNLDVQLP